MGSNYLPTEYQSFIHLSRYSRWLEDEGRRESWSETVGRLISYFKNHMNNNYKGVIKNKEWDQNGRKYPPKNQEYNIKI